MKEYTIKLDVNDLICLEIGDIDVIDTIITKIIKQGVEQGYELQDEDE